MLSQTSAQILNLVISHTPLWVWAILCFLIYRGIVASKDRTVNITSASIIPIVMLGLSLQGIVSAVGHSAFVLLSWLLSLLVFTFIFWKLGNKSNISACNSEDKILLKGSWLPLILMMGIFCTKYVINVALAIQPQLHQNFGFIVIVCVLFGVMNGLFVGKLLQIIALYKQANTAHLLRA
jgi:hypothetical protein